MRIKIVNQIPNGCHLMAKSTAKEFARAAKADGQIATIYQGKIPLGEYYPQRMHGRIMFGVKVS